MLPVRQIWDSRMRQGRISRCSLCICDILSSYSICLYIDFTCCSRIPLLVILHLAYFFFFFPSESQFKIRKFLKKCGKFNHHHFKQKWWWREGGSRHWQWLLMRGPCYTKCGSWISIIKSPESLLEMQDLRSTPDLLSQKLNFNKILRGFMCIAKTKKQCPKLHGIVGFINMMLEVA